MYDLIIFLILLIMGYLFGTLAERKHYKSIKKREQEFISLPTIMLKKPLNNENIIDSRLVNGSVVISIDFFKKFVAALINIFGGNISTYETLVDRARREAILRMKEDATDANEIINIRIETSSISKNAKAIGTVEVLAYGTAIYREI
ncbi:YbjQ family protein [Campylobacterota bacterium DY0563]